MDVFEVLVTAAGWVGALTTVAAYALVTRRRLAPDSVTYQGLNSVGAGLLALSATASSAWPSAVVNYIWVLIGVQALVAMRQAVRAGLARRAQRLRVDAGRLKAVPLLPRRARVTPEDISAAVLGSRQRRRLRARHHGDNPDRRSRGPVPGRPVDELAGAGPMPSQFMR